MAKVNKKIKINKIASNNIGGYDLEISNCTGLRKIKGITKVTFSSSNKVNDVYRYKYSHHLPKLITHSNIVFTESNFNDLQASNITNSIVLILESPHKHEYNYKNNSLNPIAPAQGSTGDAIEKHLVNVIKEIVKKNKKLKQKLLDKPVIICNPIQWQTSLHYYYSNKNDKLQQSLRNTVWKGLWKFRNKGVIPIQTDFLKRLNIYNPILIINACTGGTSEYLMNSIVSCYLDTIIKSLSSKPLIVRAYHPSINWNKGKFLIL